MVIVKSVGVTNTERLLADLCDNTFLKLWSYPNPYKADQKELCDLLVIFEDEAFVFFDREKTLNEDPNQDPQVTWERWKRRVVDAQIKTAFGAERYLLGGGKIYLDSRLSDELPVAREAPLKIVHKIIVAHGVKEACLKASSENVYGSLAISYADKEAPTATFPFMISLRRDHPLHVFDSSNLPILLSELDTVWDFSDYLKAKLRAIEECNALMYCGEEDLLAHYFLNYDETEKRHRIGPAGEGFNSLYIGEGEWKDFQESETYKATKEANEISYMWDSLLQLTSANALDGKLLGISPLEHGRSAIHEMAKEPRFSRRALAVGMYRAISNFPDNVGDIGRNLSLMPSFYPEKRYVFLQLKVPDELRNADDYRAKRQYMLEIACGAAKNAFPNIELIVGIAIDAPKFCEVNSEDFALMDCSQWSEERAAYYEEANEPFGFFKSGYKSKNVKLTRFVPPSE